MKIAFLANANSIHTVRWANEMSSRGHEMYVISMHERNDALLARIKYYKLAFKPPYGYYINVPQIRRLLRNIEPDVLHAHYASGYGTSARLSGFHPYILSIWGSDIYEYPRLSNRNRRTLVKNLKAPDFVTSTSYAMRKEAEQYNEAGKSIDVIPFGIDTNQFAPMEREENNHIVIGTVKSLEPVYGIQYLIKAVTKLIGLLNLNNEYRDIAGKIKLLIVGEGSMFAQLKQLTRESNIENITEFVGRKPHDQIPYWLNKMDIFCVPSLSESFGVSAIEASACALPVIASNVGGLTEVVKHGETGYIIPPANVNLLAERLYELVLDPHGRKKMGIRGREFVKDNYEWTNNANLMEQLYLRISGRKEQK